jgi:hypothetical protein
MEKEKKKKRKETFVRPSISSLRIHDLFLFFLVFFLFFKNFQTVAGASGDAAAA